MTTGQSCTPMNIENPYQHLTNAQLLKKVGIAKVPDPDAPMQRMLSQLHTHEIANALREIAFRYGEQRLKPKQKLCCAADVYNHFRVRLGTVQQHLFMVVLLNTCNQYMTDTVVTQGTLNRSLIHPREAFFLALAERAASVVFVSNHPSGSVEPSSQEIEVTQRLVEVGKVIRIPVVDHVIIGDGYCSLADNGLL